jgi:pantoate--beta-alanine ligase
MQIVETLAELAAARAGAPGRLGYVPTMGYLHAGHLSLVHRARVECETVTVSIFINPAQFSPNEDLARYPRDVPHDLALLEAAGVDVVFLPPAAEVYPTGFATYVVPEGAVAERLEAASRPGHFRGVCTVVLKLFNMVQPHTAYFGQKDAQQVAVLRRMLRDLNLPVTMRVLPTVREPDGLAMSSRNSYLGQEGRAAATILVRALQAGRAALDTCPTEGVQTVLDAMRARLAAEPRADLDYVDVCDPDTFEPLIDLRAPALLALAARVGPVRLIDNFVLRADGVWDTGTTAQLSVS